MQTIETLNVPNRNGRIYTTSLANKIIKQFEDCPPKSVMGTLATDFTDAIVRLSAASHIVNKMWIDDNKLMAEIEILQTPTGKIIQLFDKPVFRLAGVGSIKDDGTLDEDSYKFVTLIAANDQDQS